MLVRVGQFEQDRISREVTESSLLLNTDHVVYAVPGVFRDGDGEEYPCWTVKMVTEEMFVINAQHLGPEE